MQIQQMGQNTGKEKNHDIIKIYHAVDSQYYFYHVIYLLLIHFWCIQGPDSHYGTKGMRKVAVECPSGDRATFQFTYAAGNNNGTSVEDGQIPEIIFYTQI